MNHPKITVVTVCYNAERDIEKTIQSVINQTYDNIEYIIVDGASTDGTMQVVEKYKDKIAKIVSEPDKGIYDAMNKGIKLATGEWINFMNAGDWFAEKDVLENVFAYEAPSGTSVIYGDSIHRHSFRCKRLKAFSLDKIKNTMVFSHQSCFVRVSYTKSNPFDTKYRYAADYNMLYMLYLIGYKFFYIPIAVSSVIVDEGATAANFKKSKKEVYDIHVSNGVSWISAYITYHYEVWYFYIREAIKSILPDSILNRL